MILEWLVEQQAEIRGYVFFGMLSLMVLWESLRPAKPSTTSTPVRWINNGCLTALDNGVVRLIYPLFAVALAVHVSTQEFGLFHLLEVPIWLALPLTLFGLDLTAYVMHRLLHRVPWLWRLHKVHHADLDYDVTTGLRFHPVESVLTVGSTLAVVAALGAPPAGVVVYEVLFYMTSLLNHGNVHLPYTIDRTLRRLFVTPDMHRIHHSIVCRESNSNFSSIFSIWDHLFGSYCLEPAAGQKGMVMGLNEYRTAASVNLLRLLTMPFTGQTPPISPVDEPTRTEAPGNS